MANQPTKYRKFLAGAATASLVATAVVPSALAANFSDVSENNSHKEHIDALAAAGIISGYEDGSFGPNNSLTRSHVVKMMGKWLVSLGHEVPADYKTVQRFEDISLTTKDEELLKFSALVKDKGVFVGNEGKLDPSSNITRENMAVVLVRAFDAVNGTDLVNYVKEQTFNRDVTDLDSAKAEARSAIDVLDFFDITNPAAPVFNPKGTVTRGQFASFLNKTIKTENPTPVVTTATKVESVSATNLKEVVVTFDGTVDEDTASDKANYSLKSGKAIKSVALAADGKSVTITVVGTLANNKVDAVSLSNVKAGDKTIDAKNVEFTTVDNVLPEVKEIKSLGTKSVKVSFSEPVEDLKQTNFTLDGKAYFGNVVMGAGNKSVILTPYSSTALAVGDHKLTVSGVKDFAGFTSLNSTHDFTVVEDKNAPTVTEATATLESVTLTFSEDVDPSTVVASKVYWKSGDSKKTASGEVEALADNKYKFYFSTANTLPTGAVDIHVEGVKDYSGNEIAKDTKVSVTPEIDQTRPEVRKVSVNNAAATEIKVTFSKSINDASAKVLGNYTVTDSKGKVVSVSDAKLDPNDSKSVIVSLYRGLTVGENKITVKNVKDATKLQNTMLDFTGTVVKSDQEAPTYDAAVNTQGRQVVLKFDKKMDIDTLTNYSNYLVRIDGTLQTLTPAIADISVLQDSTAVVITFVETISDKEVVLASGTGASGKTNVNELTVLGLKDTAGNLLKEFAENGVGPITNIVPLNVDTRVELTEFDSDNHAGKVAELVDTKTIEVNFDTGINSAESGAFVAKVNGSTVAIDSVIVDGSSTVTLKMKEALRTDANGLTIDVDYTKLVNIAGNKGVNPTPGAQIASGNLLDSVNPTPVFAAGETEYAVNGNTIIISYSEALDFVAAADQNLRDTDFEITRISNNTKLKPETEYDAVVVGNTIEITLTDTRAAATAYTVSVKDAKYFTDASGNEIADSTGRSKLVGTNATVAINALNAGLDASPVTLTDADYTAAGITGVTSTNITAINTAVKAGKTAGTNLSVPAIQTLVDAELARLAAAADTADINTVASGLTPTVTAGSLGTLPTSVNGVTIAWTSGDTAVILNNGNWVAAGNTTLTATLTKGTGTQAVVVYDVVAGTSDITSITRR